MSAIKLKSSDGDVFIVDEQVAKVSETLRTMFDSGAAENDDEPVLLSNVSSFILVKVIEWMKFHKNDPFYPKEESPKKDGYGVIKRKAKVYHLKEWESDFLCLDQSTLIELFMAAKFLHIQSLKDATCQTMANMLTPEQVRQVRTMFNLDESDLTPEEIAQIEAGDWECEDGMDEPLTEKTRKRKRE